MTMFSFRLGTTQNLVSILALALLLGWTSLTLAIKPDPSEPGGHLLIKEVDVVVGALDTTFTIRGQDFDFVNLSDIVVSLGDYMDPLGIDPGATSILIVATLDEAILPGEYLLTVSTGSGQS